MAKPLPPIEDYYGTEIKVDVVLTSPAPVVDLERSASPEMEDAARDYVQGDGGIRVRSFDRLDPDQADELADRLKAAAKEARANASSHPA